MQATHPLFGQLDTSALDPVEGDFWAGDVLWDGFQALNGRQVRLDLWAVNQQVLALPELDALAQSLGRLPELDSSVRQHLERHLAANPMFMDEHATPEALAVYTDWAAQLAALGGQVSVAQFVQHLQLVRVGLYPGQPFGHAIVMDYQIDPEHSDQILAVKLTAQGELTAVDWES